MYDDWLTSNAAGPASSAALPPSSVATADSGSLSSLSGKRSSTTPRDLSAVASAISVDCDDDNGDTPVSLQQQQQQQTHHKTPSGDHEQATATTAKTFTQDNGAVPVKTGPSAMSVGVGSASMLFGWSAAERLQSAGVGNSSSSNAVSLSTSLSAVVEPLLSRKTKGPPCKVCGDEASGFHYGVDSCEGCKGFFRRCLTQGMNHQCAANQRCEITPYTRNSCQWCRLKRCKEVGMSRDASRLGRRPKRLQEARRLRSELFNVHGGAAVALSSASGNAAAVDQKRIINPGLTMSQSTAAAAALHLAVQELCRQRAAGASSSLRPVGVNSSEESGRRNTKVDVTSASAANSQQLNVADSLQQTVTDEALQYSLSSLSSPSSWLNSSDAKPPISPTDSISSLSISESHIGSGIPSAHQLTGFPSPQSLLALNSLQTNPVFLSALSPGSYMSPSRDLLSPFNLKTGESSGALKCLQEFTIRQAADNKMMISDAPVESSSSYQQQQQSRSCLMLASSEPQLTDVDDDGGTTANLHSRCSCRCGQFGCASSGSGGSSYGDPQSVQSSSRCVDDRRSSVGSLPEKSSMAAASVFNEMRLLETTMNDRSPDTTHHHPLTTPESRTLMMSLPIQIKELSAGYWSLINFAKQPVVSGERCELINTVTKEIIRVHRETCRYTKEKLEILMKEYHQRVHGKPEGWDLEELRRKSNVPKELEHENWFQEFFNQMDPTVRRVVDFCRLLPCYKELKLEDQVALIKQGMFGVIMVRYCRLFTDQGLYIPTMSARIPRSRVGSMPGAMGKFFEMQYDFADKFNPLQLVDGEIGLLASVLIVNPDREGVAGKKEAREILRLYLQCLYNYLKSSRPDNYEEFFNQLMSLLPTVEAFNDIHLKILESTKILNPSIRFPALHEEVFD